MTLSAFSPVHQHKQCSVRTGETHNCTYTVVVSCFQDEHKLQVFENKVLRKTHEPKNDKASQQFRILHNEEQCDLYRSPTTRVYPKVSRLSQQ